MTWTRFSALTVGSDHAMLRSSFLAKYAAEFSGPELWRLVPGGRAVCATAPDEELSCTLTPNMG